MFLIFSYVLRSRHSIGEVSCLSIDEVVSLPAEANIKVRLHVHQLTSHSQNAIADAQAFLSLKKL